MANTKLAALGYCIPSAGREEVATLIGMVAVEVAVVTLHMRCELGFARAAMLKVLSC